MHDPMTVAFEIRYPWRKHGAKGRNEWERNYRDSFITIWHADPCKRRLDPSARRDDSCGWPWPYLDKCELDLAHRLIVDPVDNIRSFFPDCDADDAEGRLRQCFRILKSLHRHWWNHPRWHVWHWRLQVHPVQAFKRWAFSRCCVCGGHFSWGYSPISGNWDGVGPLWFRSEGGVYHAECSEVKKVAGHA